MRILANDGLVDEAVNFLRREGFSVDTEKRDYEDLLGDLPDFDALLVRSATKVNRELIEAATTKRGKLKIIGRGGVGTDNIDLQAAKECGVVVKFAPHGNINATAEHVIGLMFAIARKVPFAHHTLKSGIWHKARFKGVELQGKTLGLIGCGRIGQAVATKAKDLDMKVIGFDMQRWMDSEVDYMDSMEEVLDHADFVSINTGGAHTLIREPELERMKSSAFLINASRGVNVEEDALYYALKNGRIAGAALDCYEKEPKREGEPFTSKLAELDNIVLSAHLGASTANAARKTGMEIADVVSKYLKYGDFRQSVNVGQTVIDEGIDLYTIFITHEDKPGMFGKFGTAFGDLGVNIQENNSRRLDGLAQTIYTIQEKPTSEMQEKLLEIDGVRRVVY
ncbi:NAD(P)-dependent oxidoreductase [Desulfonatronospira sp. MSAO_Bac3]|uniref:NAD(P)-dependent oxidoreductase n=1 Tax=Desulfonatronospira sp. MSAO_Bac3 TaxID=2293857 RepID=UPI000FF1A60E|nr:NAD(P)-dependent oxidoreductase [Desulfonatronospira sp. MSAO_Bac3]RQD74505.1 MAG: ACT domain-containing protein [Desulfonatronospira sp. MSAO_Bac3]